MIASMFWHKLRYTKYMVTDPSHHIDRHILKVLTFNAAARYRDLRPKNTDSNLFNYHRKMLLQQGYIRQNSDKTYSLAGKGLRLAEKVTLSDLRVRDRPKLSVIFLLTNKQGDLAVWEKAVQPFVGTVNLPNGKMHFEDVSVDAAARRMLGEITTAAAATLTLRGTAEIYINYSGEPLVHAVYMVMAANIAADSVIDGKVYWVKPQQLPQLTTTPGVVSLYADFANTPGCLYKYYQFDL